MSQPTWHAPPTPSAQVQEKLPQLTVYNSLTRSKTPFVPLDPEGKKVGWYVCGPTVYDDSHLGHARNYVSTDIIRRIMQDYFGFDVNFVMNITDVDDKIILAARQQYLLSQWLEKQGRIDGEVLDTTTKALDAYVAKNLPLIGEAKPETYKEVAEKQYGHVLRGKSLANDGTPPGDKEAKVKMHLRTAEAAVDALNGGAEASFDAFAAKASGVLLPYIDSLHKATVSGKDHDIFTVLTKRYEERFFADMAALNVLYPDKLTRVTEYGPQIVDFVKQIQGNGYAYEHEGSVYYDTNGWEATGGVYARLEPWNRNDKDLQQDGEGSLSTNTTGFKRSAADFALWKASKEGEPSWSSPWGEGRPGWHIECSAMASDVLGKQLDIHSGGIDLAFPHHDNELAQSEAYWAKTGSESVQWVNYFLHMGHLSIQGSKMSKSLKNFTTIREALTKEGWTPRSLRTVFLLGTWKDGLEITPDIVKAASTWEDKVSNFFIKIRDIQRNAGGVSATITAAVSSLADSIKNLVSDSQPSQNGSGTASTIEEAFDAAKLRFHEALCDSFDTPTAMRVISDLVTSYNSEKNEIPAAVSLAIGQWVSDVVVLFGLDATHVKGNIGWTEGVELPKETETIVYPLSHLRDVVRRQAMSGAMSDAEWDGLSEQDKQYPESQPFARAQAEFQRTMADLYSQNAGAKSYLAECDRLRDETLWNLGVYLEDREKQPALVRPLSNALRQERADREAQAADRAAAKAKLQAEKAAAEQEKLNKGRLSHLEMYRTSEYSAWDADGLPTADQEGQEIAKSRGKKLKKDWERQKKLHEAWQAAQGDQGS